MLETTPTRHHQQAYKAAHAARGAALRDVIRWIVECFHMPLRFETTKALTASSR